MSEQYCGDCNCFISDRPERPCNCDCHDTVSNKCPGDKN